MNREPKRELIGAASVKRIFGMRPLVGVGSLSGVRIHDVGQGDSISILDGEGNAVLQIDYGGRQGHPFGGLGTDEVDKRMPVGPAALLMMTHWDEDHWSSAPRGNAARAARWLVPRQLTSPRAVRFASGLDQIACIPEEEVGEVFAFEAENGDAVLWEKLSPSAQSEKGTRENCNRTGVALSLVRRDGEGGEAILVPGDAAFGHVRHYWQLRDAGLTLAGLVAFHHGSGCHWTRTTRRLLREWPKSVRFEIVASCSGDNSYGHPDRACYAELFPDHPLRTTADERAAGSDHVDLRFAG